MAPAGALCILGPANGLVVLTELSSDRASNQHSHLRAMQGSWDAPYGQRYLPGAGPVELPADSQGAASRRLAPPGQCAQPTSILVTRLFLVLVRLLPDIHEAETCPLVSSHFPAPTAHNRGLINAWVKNSLGPHLSFRFVFICSGCTGSSLPHESFL